MKNFKNIMTIFLISAAANGALAADIDAIDPTSVGLSSTTTVSPSVGSSSSVIAIAPTVKVKVPYKVYVSAVIDPTITTSSKDGKEIFAMLKGTEKGEVDKFITPEICSPHVTLFQGEVDLAGEAKADKLKAALKIMLDSYKNTKVTVKDSEVGGMHAGGASSYFIAYNVNDETSDLKTMAKLVKSKVGTDPKTYGDYTTAMKSSGFGGMFSKHLPTSDEPMLHISVLRAFTTKKIHPEYGAALENFGGILEFYNNLRSTLSKVFDKITEEQKQKIIEYVLQNYDGKTDLFATGKTKLLDGLSYKNKHMNATTLVKMFNTSFTKLYVKKNLNALDKDQVLALVKDLRDKPASFFKNGKQNGTPRKNLQFKLLRDEGIYAVSGTAAPLENKKADDLCLALQKTVVGDLNLKITDFQVDVSPKTTY